MKQQQHILLLFVYCSFVLAFLLKCFCVCVCLLMLNSTPHSIAAIISDENISINEFDEITKYNITNNMYFHSILNTIWKIAHKIPKKFCWFLFHVHLLYWSIFVYRVNVRYQTRSKIATCKVILHSHK